MSDKQARGYKGKIHLEFEEEYGVTPAAADRKPFLVAINNFSPKASDALNDDPLIRGTRNPAPPGRGNVDVSGDAGVPLDAHMTGQFLRAMFGLPVSTLVEAVSLSAGAVVDKGTGKVGLPAVGHGLEPGTPVIIDGTVNYDGDYVLTAETSADELVISATYVAETVSAADTVTPARRVTLTAGDVADKSGGKVGLPAAAHGLPVGAEITVTGTTAYDATYTVLRGTTANELVVTATYVEETLDGSEVADCRFYNHVYSVSDEQPSMSAGKVIPDIGLYSVCSGLKIGSVTFSGGGSGVVGLSLPMSGRDEAKESAAYDADPAVASVQYPLHRFSQKHARIEEGGESLTKRVITVSMDVNFNLDTGEEQYTIGSGGRRGDLPEGIMALSGSVSALLKDSRFIDRGENAERTSMKLSWVNGGYAIVLFMEELEFSRNYPALSGPQGMKEDFSFTSFLDTGSAGSALVVTLRNEIKTWEV